MDRVPFDPNQGFLPAMAPAFKARHGEGSRLVRAAADVATQTMIGLLRRSGRLPADAPVPQVGEERARESLRLFLGTVPGLRNVFTRVIAGDLPAGELEARADRALGAGAFARWRERFEAGAFDEADALHPQADD